MSANNPVITRLLLQRGANPNDGESLYQAAGHPDHRCLRLLLDHGAELDARDANFNGTPLGFATVTSGVHPESNSDWVATVRLLLHAGADPTGVWVPAMAPREDVADVLRSYGITGTDNAVPGA